MKHFTAALKVTLYNNHFEMDLKWDNSSFILRTLGLVVKDKVFMINAIAFPISLNWRNIFKETL